MPKIKGTITKATKKIVTILLIDGNITVKKGLGDFP